MFQKLLPSRLLSSGAGEAGGPEGTQNYDAFISYSRNDQDFARRLEQKLEGYRLPKSLNIPTRNLRVFLDTSDIHGADYDQIIEREIGRSRALIVLCSPAARKSPYVDDEIRCFITARRAKNEKPQILPLLLEGIPNNEAKTADDKGRKAFPEALYDAAAMPLSQSFLRFDPKQHKLDRGGFRDAWFATLASLFNVERHELEERDTKRQARTRRIITGATLLVLIVVSGLAGLAWYQRGEAIAQRNQALRQESRALAALAQGETSAGRPVEGILLALRGMPIPNTNDQRPVVTETRQALIDGMLARRELMVLNGHEDAVSSAAFSPDGVRIVSGSWDHTVRVWRATSGGELLVLKGHLGPVRATGFSPDGARIVSGSDDGTVRIWDADKGGDALLVLEDDQSTVYATAFSPDGARIVSGHSDGAVRVWDAAIEESPVVLRGHDGHVYAAAFSPDGARIVSGSIDGTIRIWDADKDGDALLVLEDDQSAVYATAFSPDGAHIVSGHSDGALRVWDAASEESPVVLRGHDGPVYAAAFSCDGDRIVSGSFDDTIRVWDAASESELMLLRGHGGAHQASSREHDGSIFAATFSCDGDRIVSGSHDNTVRVWDVGSGVEPLVLYAGLSRAEVINAAAFSADGARIVIGLASSHTSGGVRVWDATSGEMALRGREGGVYAAAFSPDGERVVIGKNLGALRVWNEANEEMRLHGHEINAMVSAVGFSPDGARIVSGSWDHTVRVWDAESGGELLVLKGHLGPVLAAGFSPDGARIVSGSDDGTVRIWDADKGGDALLVLKDVQSEVFATAYSPDGAHIVSGSDDGVVRVWDAANGSEKLTLRGHLLRRGNRGGVRAARFSPSGARIVSGGVDATVRVWDSENGEELLVLRGHDGPVLDTGFSPDGARIVSGSEDQTVRVWFVGDDDAALVAHACSRLPRDLSPKTFRRFNLDPAAPWPCADRAKTLWPHPTEPDISSALHPDESGVTAAVQ